MSVNGGSTWWGRSVRRICELVSKRRMYSIVFVLAREISSGNKWPGFLSSVMVGVDYLGSTV